MKRKSKDLHINVLLYCYIDKAQKQYNNIAI